MLRRILGLASLAILAGSLTWADSWNKKTVLRVNETIQVPGAVLQPGVYVFKLLDSLADRHIVCIMNENENEVITTILAIPNYRLEPTDKSQFRFWETPAGNPRALRAWFYPGDNFGQEFAYPQGMSAKIAQVNEAPVPTTEATKETELAQAPVNLTDKMGIEKPFEAKLYPPPALEPAAEPAPAPAPVQQQADRPAMPMTASPMPVIALAGFLFTAAGFALRRFR